MDAKCLPGMIEELGKAEDFKTFTKRIQAILRVLTYYALQSEGCVLEAQEEWLAEFTDRLRREKQQGDDGTI